MKHMRTNTLARLVLVATLLFVLVGLAPNAALAEGNQKAPASYGSKAFTQVNIYLIGIGAGKVGCGDQVVPVKRTIAPTQAPLTAALNQLLSLHTQYYGQSGLNNALYQSNLAVQKITAKGTTWNIYLRGSLQLGGVCDIPRVEAQLQRTALQFSTVKRVNYYVNGVPLKTALSLK